MIHFCIFYCGPGQQLTVWVKSWISPSQFDVNVVKWVQITINFTFISASMLWWAFLKHNTRKQRWVSFMTILTKGKDTLCPRPLWRPIVFYFKKEMSKYSLYNTQWTTGRGPMILPEQVGTRLAWWSKELHGLDFDLHRVRTKGRGSQSPWH